MQNGFAVIGRGAHVAVRIYSHPPATGMPLVHHHETDDVIAVVMGRLYYRDDLRRSLGDAVLATDADDAELAVAAYRKFGDVGMERLHGDFSVAVFDRRQRRIVATRDPSGGYPICWVQQKDTIAVATGLRPLVELLPAAEVNLATLGELQMLPYAEIDYFGETVFQGIQRLVAGNMLTADLAAGTVAVREHWNWSQHAADLSDVADDQLAERYAELLRQAVRERLRGTIAAHYSGGMDSTSMALLAAEVLSPAGNPVHALSLVYERFEELAREKPYLEGALDTPGIVPHRINGDDVLDYDLFRDTPLHDEPYTGLFRAGTDIVMFNAAKDAGCDTVFTGLGADEVLADAPYYIADFVKRGHWIRGWREASKWSREYNSSIWRFLGPYGISPLMPAWWHAGWKPLFRGGFANWNRQNQSTIASWIRPEFAKSQRLRQRAAAHTRRNFKQSRSVVQSDALARIQFTGGDWVRTEMAAPLGILHAHPFRDHNVLAFGLGARRRIQPKPGEQKRLLAEAMRGVLPENIRTRRGKGHFNSVFYAGISRNLPHLEAMVNDSTINELGLYDKTELLRCMNKAALGVGAMSGVWGLNNSLAIIKWHAQLPAWLAHKPEPTRVIDVAPPHGRFNAGSAKPTIAR